MSDDPKRTLKEIADQSTTDSSEFLEAVMSQAANACDVLADEVEDSRDVNDERDTSQMCTRHVQSLKFLSDMYFQKRKNNQKIDIHSPEMQIVFKAFLEKVKETFVSMDLEREVVGDFFRELDNQLAGWEEELAEHLENFREEGA